jgi:hypothetical protein
MLKSIHVQIEDLRYGEKLQRIPESEYPPFWKLHKDKAPIEAWSSRGFLLMVFIERGGIRLSIMRTLYDENTGRFSDGISWDDLERLKYECGRGEEWAVEIFPPRSEIVNVQNMRHLFVLPEPPPYGWHKKRSL